MRKGVRKWRLALVCMMTLSVLSLIVCLIVIAVTPGDFGAEKIRYDFDTEEIKTDLVYISSSINVRSQPIATEQHNTVYAGTAAGAAGYGIRTTSVPDVYGQNKHAIAVPVECVYWPTNCHWDDYSCNGGDYHNGPFIGLRVNDITEIPNWDKCFPKRILKDPDGIVWVSLKTGAVRYYEIISSK